MQNIHRGKFKALNAHDRRLFKLETAKSTSFNKLVKTLEKSEMGTDENQVIHQDASIKIADDDYKPNTVPAFTRLKNLFSSAALLAYGTYGLWINDLYIPGNRSAGVHLHDLPAWVMFGAFFSACVVMISACIDHYDKRNNEIKYKKLSNTFQQIAWGFFLLSISMQITDFDGSLNDLKSLVPVFLVASLILIMISRRIKTIEARDSLQLQKWKEAEQNELDNCTVRSSPEEYSFISKNNLTIKYSEEPHYMNNSLVALVIKRTLRNPAGEYFYWIWQSDGPHLLRHITQVNAKIILKGDYLEPKKSKH